MPPLPFPLPQDTRETMLSMFGVGEMLLGRRNWCRVTERAQVSVCEGEGGMSHWHWVCGRRLGQEDQNLLYFKVAEWRRLPPPSSPSPPS